MKVLVSLDPTQLDLLKIAAFARGALERRPADVSALIREIIEKSEYWEHLSTDVMYAMQAVAASPSAKQLMNDLIARNTSKRTGKPKEGAAAEALRAGYLTAMRDPSDPAPLASPRLLLHVVDRLRAQAAASVKRARERAGFTPQGLAKRAGLPLKKVEAAESGVINGEIATKLGAALDVDPHTLCPPDLWGKS